MFAMEPAGTVDRGLVKDFNRCRIVPMLVGVFPLTLADDRLVTSFTGLVFSIILVIFLVTCFLIQVFFFNIDDIVGTSSEEIMVNIDYGLLNFAVVLCLVTSIRKKQQLFYVLQVLSETKSFLKDSNVPWRPKKRFLNPLIQSFAFLLFNVFDPDNYGGSLADAANVFSFCYLVIATIWIFSQFMYFANLLAECFRRMTSCVKTSCSGDDLERLMNFHCLLTIAANQLNSIYSLGFTLAFVASFLLSLSQAYYFIDHVVKRSPVLYICTFLVWCVVLLILCFEIVRSCEGVKNQAKRFDTVLYRLLVYKSPPNITQKNTTLKLFFHFSGKPEVKFTLTGFFKLDWGLLYSMLAAGCTYLVIIVQFSNLDKQ